MTNKKIKELERERDNFKAHLDIALKEEDRLRAEVAKLEAKSARQHYDFENLTARQREMTDDRNSWREQVQREISFRAVAKRERDKFKTHLDIALKEEYRLRAEVAKLEGVRLALLDGQEGLKRQTVRIRRALTDGVEDGVDTEEIARRVRCERDEARRERDEAKSVDDVSSQFGEPSEADKKCDNCDRDRDRHDEYAVCYRCTRDPHPGQGKAVEDLFSETGMSVMKRAKGVIAKLENELREAVGDASCDVVEWHQRLGGSCAQAR